MSTVADVEGEKEEIALANLTAFTVTPPPAPRQESALLKEWTSAELLRKEVVQTYKWAAEIAPAFQQWEALNDVFAGDSKWKDLRQNAMEAARLNLLLQSSTATGLSGGAPGGFPELPEHSRFDVPGSLRGGDYVAPIFDSTGAHTASVDLTQLERYIVRCQENNDAGLVELRNYLRELQKASRTKKRQPTLSECWCPWNSGRGGRGGYRGGEAPTGMPTSATTPLQMQGK
eukprot:gene1631-1000_t